MQFSLASFLLHPGGITFQGSVFPTHYCPCCQKPTMIEMGFQIVPRCPPGEGCGTRQEVGSLRSGITTALTSKDPSNPSIPKQQAINRPFVSLSLLAIAQCPVPTNIMGAFPISAAVVFLSAFSALSPH